MTSGDACRENPRHRPNSGTTVMTIGTLARRSGVSVKTLRQYENLGLLHTVGRSGGNYRLFDEDALWCVGTISTLRTLGLTLAELQDLTAGYLQQTSQPVGPRLATLLAAVRTRTRQRIADLQQRLTLPLGETVASAWC